MPTTILVTRNAPDRFRGFLASCMLEVAPGTYLSPDMTKSVRGRVWDILVSWQEALPEDGGLLLLWPDKHAPSGVGMSFIGFPKKEIVQYQELWLVRDPLTSAHRVRLHKDEASQEIDDEEQ